MENVLVAVSGGCDSLALLDILYTKKAYNLIVCHVNYNYRESATRDRDIVINYCKDKKIKYYLIELDSKKEKEGNFENWARVKRYKFFKEIYNKEKCSSLYVGHHKDDCIETYLIQKQRNSIVEYYGLKRETIILGMRVIRPLLDYSKKELEDYCLKKAITYGVDETNFDLRYLRNKIRNDVISKMSEEEKNNLILEIKKLNEEKKEYLTIIEKVKKSCLIDSKCINLNIFNELEDTYKKEILYRFIIENVYRKISISSNRILDILKKIKSDKPNIILAQYDEFILYKEYDRLVIEEEKENYCYEIQNIENGDISKEYCISSSGKKLEKVEVCQNQFPLYLKNYDGKNKDINRIFINKKVPLRQRKSWPVIVDKFGSLLLVIGIKKFYNKMRDLNENLIEFYVCKK